MTFVGERALRGRMACHCILGPLGPKSGQWEKSSPKHPSTSIHRARASGRRVSGPAVHVPRSPSRGLPFHERPGRRLVSLASSSRQTTSDDVKVAADALQDDLSGTCIYLVGMMGSGKSTVGNVLARAMGYRFFDSDDLIEKTFQAPVREIFEDNGEEVFREIEARVLQELSQYTKSVISTGGGAVIRRENWGNMRHGIVLWLSGSPELLASRVVGEEQANRPLLDDIEGDAGALAAKLQGILEERERFYSEADAVVALESKEGGGVLSPEQVALSVLSKVSQLVASKKDEIRERKNFKVEGLPETMQVEKPRKGFNGN